MWFDFSIVLPPDFAGGRRGRSRLETARQTEPLSSPLFFQNTARIPRMEFSFYDNVMTDLLFFFPTLYWSFVSSYGQGNNHWVFSSPILSADKGPVTSENERPGSRGRQSTNTPLLATPSHRMGRRVVEGSNALRPRAHSASLVRQTRIFC